MPRPPLLQTENAWWVCRLPLILAFGFAPRLLGATVIIGDVTPALPWNSSTATRIGNTGAGTLALDGGGQLTSGITYLGYNMGSTGMATITGAGSKWTSNNLYVGRHGSGTLCVEAGGHVSSGYYAFLGYGDGAGTATITGAGSTWTNSIGLYVGDAGSGTLRVEEGGLVTCDFATLARTDDSTGMATITGAGSKWINDGPLYLGGAGSGELRVEAGGEVSNTYCCLGDESGSTGVATITGAGSKWTNSSELYVGNSGNGALTVEDGGQVTALTLYASLDDLHGDGTIAANGAVLDANLQFNAANSTQISLGFGAGGALMVTAAGGNLGAGYHGVGSLSIADGVSVSSSAGYLGYHPGSTGTATITGAGSKWSTNAALQAAAKLHVGYAGNGSLRVEAGGEVSSTYFGYLGHASGSTGTATITGAGSKWTNGSTLYVAFSGNGALRVEAGGLVTNTFGTMGCNTDSTGTATITGAGSKWTNSLTLNIGHSGNGALRVEAGGQVSNAAGYLAREQGATGSATVTGAGSTWINSAELNIGHSGNGELRVEAGGQVSNTAGYVGFTASSTGSATVTDRRSKWTSSSHLVVGRSGSGTLTISRGGLVSVKGTLTIDANGGNDSFVNLTTGGMLALWGDADDSLAQFLGLVAGTDAIRYWASSPARWEPLTAATLGVDYSLQYQSAGALAGYTLLAVGPPGDFDFDGRVDGADLLAWQRGDSPLPISPEDLATWKANFGLGLPTPEAAAVPEPQTFALIGLAVAGALLRCRSACSGAIIALRRRQIAP